MKILSKIFLVRIKIRKGLTMKILSNCWEPIAVSVAVDLQLTLGPLQH